MSFKEGKDEATFNITIIDDIDTEDDEDFSLSISESGLPLGFTRKHPYLTSVTIVDDDCK